MTTAVKVNNKTVIKNLPIVGKQPENEKEEQFLRELVKCEFYNLEEPGLAQKFPYGNTNNHRIFTFFHGGKYKIPRHLMRWVDTRSTPIWKWRPDGKGGLDKERVGDNPRFSMRQVF